MKRLVALVIFGALVLAGCDFRSEYIAPVAGTIVDTPTATVTGTVPGGAPAGGTITVNGVTGTWDGDNWSAVIPMDTANPRHPRHSHPYGAEQTSLHPGIDPDLRREVQRWRVFTGGRGDGQYLSGGPFVGPYGVGNIAGDTVWGLRAVITSAIAAGTVLVGAFREGAQVFYRSGLTVEASNSHANFFQNNMTALRAEQRAALAVHRPAGFVKITLTA
jgi:Phage capsid family